METLPPATTSVTLHGDTDERPDLGESLESATVLKEEDTEPPEASNAEDKYPNVSPNESKQAGSGDCTELAASVPVGDSQSGAESGVEGADHSVDDGSKTASNLQVPNSDTKLEEKPVPSDPGQEQDEMEKLATTEDRAEAKTEEKSQKEKLSTVSDKCDIPQDDVVGACAPQPRTKSKRHDSRTVVDFEDEMELWLWMNDIIDECGEDFLKEQDYTLTKLVSETLTSAEKEDDQTEAGATRVPHKEGRKTGEDDKLHEKLNIRRQEFNRELLRRVTIRAYGRHLPKGVNTSELGHYFFETLPDMFSRIAWFDACYTQVEMNTAGDFNTLSLFIVPGVEFWAHIPLPFPLETRLSLGQQKCRLEELSLWTEFSRKRFAKTFFAVADKYKIPKFWKAQVANLDKLVLALRERTAEMKKVKKRDLKKMAPQKTFLQVSEEGYENFDKACRNLLCPKCNRQFREAVAFEVCGHELCTGCVADCLRAGALCPVCNTALKGTRFLPVWRFRWYEEKGLKRGRQENQKKPDDSQKESEARHEVVTEIVDDSRQGSEGQHEVGTEIVDDARKGSESQHEVVTEIADDARKGSEGQHEASTEIADDTRKDSESQHEVVTEIVDNSRKDSEGQHEVGTEIVDDTRNGSEGQHEAVTEIVDDSRKDSEDRHEVGTEIVDDSRKDSESQHEVVTEIAKDTRKDAEGQHEAGTEIVDDSRKDPEGQHEDNTEIVENPKVSESQSEENQTLFPEQDIGEVSESFQSLSVDDDGLETLPSVDDITRGSTLSLI